jgi:hypothetical protein
MTSDRFIENKYAGWKSKINMDKCKTIVLKEKFVSQATNYIRR